MPMRALMRTVIPSVTFSALLWRCRRLARRARVHRGRGYGPGGRHHRPVTARAGGARLLGAEVAGEHGAERLGLLEHAVVLAVEGAVAGTRDGGGDGAAGGWPPRRGAP